METIGIVLLSFAAGGLIGAFVMGQYARAEERSRAAAKAKPVHLYKVTHWVSAADLGTSSPWIAPDDESRFEADSHRVSAGALYLYRDGAVVATFAHGRWVSMIRVEEGEAAYIDPDKFKPQPCMGGLDCRAPVHIHGCFADRGQCDAPGEHSRPLVATPDMPNIAPGAEPDISQVIVGAARAWRQGMPGAEVTLTHWVDVLEENLNRPEAVGHLRPEAQHHPIGSATSEP